MNADPGFGSKQTTSERYSRAMRILHWVRAPLLLCLVGLGWYMTSLPDAVPIKFDTLYPTHKEFGVLAFMIVCIALVVRRRSRVPELPRGLARWEATLAHFTHRAIYVLALIVPLIGYARSSTYTQSDGVPFFFVMIPEILPKNDHVSEVLSHVHKYLAFTLLGLAILHILGVIKHQFFDRERKNKVLRRML
jgi:cytochrome b561